MEIVLYFLLALLILVLVFFLIEKPEKIIALIVFMMLYQFNFETPLPLDIRGLLMLILFVRVYLFNKENMRLTSIYLFGHIFTLLIISFILLILAEPLLNSKSILPSIRTIILSIIGMIIGFIAAKNEEGKKAMVFGIVLSGIISSIDLIFTFFLSMYGTIDTVKVIDLLMGKLTMINHNYPGFLAGLGLLYIYLAWYQTKINKYFLVFLVILLLLGVFISTSRSALLATVIIFILMSFLESSLRHNLRKIVPAVLIFITILTGFFITYNVFLEKKGGEKYIDRLYYRLFEEPLQILGTEEAEFDPWTGQKVKGSISYRENRWKDDFEKFTNLSLLKQFTGLGPEGYLSIVTKVFASDGNYWERLAPHNGYLIILLERGFLGLFLFIFIIISLSISAIRVSREYKQSFPFIYLLLVIVIYSFAQNSELTSPYSYLIFGCIIGDIAFSRIQLSNKINPI